MTNEDIFQEKKLKRLKLLIYLIPVIGVFPALLTIYRHQSSKEEKKVSRLAVTLTLTWFLLYCLLWLAALQTSEFLTLRLLFLNSMVTSGYFLVCLALIVRIWQNKRPYLPGISPLAEKLMEEPIDLK